MTMFDEKYWTKRYQSGQTQWDAGSVTLPIKAYFDSLTNKDIRILIPGGGNGHEAAYLHEQGFSRVYLLDFSAEPLQAFAKRYPDFPKEHLLQEDFFAINDTFDFMVEQTFFCAIHPSQRADYARQAAKVLKKGGRLVGLLFNDALNEDHPPFGGNRDEYRTYFEPYFTIHKMEPAYNSIPPRQGRELWIDLERN